MSKFYLFVFSLLISLPLTAQVSDSLLVPKKPLLTFDIGVDYLKFGALAFPKEMKYEGLAAINFKFGLSIDGEYGYTKKSPQHMYKNGEYTFEGTYYRIGLGYNYSLDERNTIGIGIRYAKSEFEQNTTFNISSALPPSIGGGNYKGGQSRKGLEAQWGELVIKSEGNLKIIKNVKLGMFIRLKVLDPIENQNDQFPIEAVPGYGLAINGKTAAFNLFVKYSIPVGR